VLRLFVPGARADGGRVRIAGAELRHLHTLRLGAGDALVVLDDDGVEHSVVLEQVTAREAVARVTASARPMRESPLDLVLAPALLKGAKMDLVVEKATELGVRRITPVETRRMVGRGNHVDRWRRIAVAAAKQSGRTQVPAVDRPRALTAFLDESWPGLRLVPWEGESSRRLDDLPPDAGAVVAVVALVGPEGGLADDEIAAAQAHGFVPITLGPRILRAETAAIAVAAHCQRRWGDG
jgi:16S rRNA (uracil1498-N3)-methyltransferase